MRAAGSGAVVGAAGAASLSELAVYPSEGALYHGFGSEGRAVAQDRYSELWGGLRLSIPRIPLCALPSIHTFFLDILYLLTNAISTAA